LRRIFPLVLCLSFLVISLIGCQDAAQRPLTPQQRPDTTTNQPDQMTPGERRAMANRLSQMAEEVDGVQRATVVVTTVGMTNTGAGMDTNGIDRNGTGMDTNGAGTNANNNNVSNNMNRPAADSDMARNNALDDDVTGQLVMVGLTLEPTATRDPATVNNTKTMVANKLKASDKRISQVLVTTDPNMIKRINDVAAGIIAGKPIQNFREDINDLNNQMKQDRPAF
jgi:hypothetical protein